VFTIVEKEFLRQVTKKITTYWIAYKRNHTAPTSLPSFINAHKQSFQFFE